MSSTSDFQHIRMSRVKDVVVVEIISKDLQGPAAARELGAELSLVSAQEWAKRLLLNFSHQVSKQHRLRRALQAYSPV